MIVQPSENASANSVGSASGIDVPTAAVAILEAGKAEATIKDIASKLKEIK